MPPSSRINQVAPHTLINIQREDGKHDRVCQFFFFYY